MRRSAFPLCLALLFSLAASAQNKDIDAIRSADQQWLKFFAARDLEHSLAMCEDGAAFLGQNAPAAEGKADISSVFSGLFALPNFKISWTLNKAEVAKSGDLGFTSGTYEDSYTDASGKAMPDHGKYVTIWRKQKDGAWKMMLDIYNSSLPEAGAR
jgi:ketosteroid isomerase-like protein